LHQGHSWKCYKNGEENKTKEEERILGK
jgi:hypothetical protein